MPGSSGRVRLITQGRYIQIRDADYQQSAAPNFSQGRSCRKCHCARWDRRRAHNAPQCSMLPGPQARVATAPVGRRYSRASTPDGRCRRHCRAPPGMYWPGASAPGVPGCANPAQQVPARGRLQASGILGTHRAREAHSKNACLYGQGLAVFEKVAARQACWWESKRKYFRTTSESGARSPPTIFRSTSTRPSRIVMIL